MLSVLRAFAFTTLLAGAAALASAPALGASAHPKVELDTTAGKIVVELDPDAAPKTVENFLAYVKAGHYDGTQFHRVIPGFMIQGGGFTADFKEKPTRASVRNEAEQAKQAGLSNTPGTIAMARTNDPHSATAQFFINVANNQRLDFQSASPGGYGYTTFGKVVSGMDVVERIANAPKGRGKPVPPGTPLDPRDVPTEPIVITKASVVDATN